MWRNEGRAGETRAAVHAPRTGVWRARRATETTAYYSEMERPVSRKRSGQAIQKGFYKHASSHQMRLRSFISCLYVGFGRWPLSGRNEASGRRADDSQPSRSRRRWPTRAAPRAYVSNKAPMSWTANVSARYVLDCPNFPTPQSWPAVRRSLVRTYVSMSRAKSREEPCTRAVDMQCDGILESNEWNVGISQYWANASKVSQRKIVFFFGRTKDVILTGFCRYVLHQISQS